MRLQSHNIDRGDKIWGFSLSIVERYLIQCLFFRVSVKRDSTVGLVGQDAGVDNSSISTLHGH